MFKNMLKAEEKQLIQCIDKLRISLNEFNYIEAQKRLNEIIEGTLGYSAINEQELEETQEDINISDPDSEATYIDKELLEYEIYEELANIDILNYKQADELLNEFDELKGDWISLFLSLKLQQFNNPKQFIASRSVINKVLGLKYQPVVSIFERFIVQKWKNTIIANENLTDQIILKDRILPEEMHKVYEIPYNAVDYKNLGSL